MNTSSLIHQEADLIAQLNPVFEPEGLRVDGVDIHNGFVRVHLSNGKFQTFNYDDPSTLIYKVKVWLGELKGGTDGYASDSVR